MDRGTAEVFEQYYEDLMRAAEDEHIHLALSRAISSYRKNTKIALERYPHTVELAKEVRRIKESAIANWESLLEQAMENIEANKGKAYFAKTGEGANKIIASLCDGSKAIVIVKAKSITGEEIDLRHYLEERGHTVWETDLGELILQLLDEGPMHILSPSIHVSRERVAEIFREKMGREVEPEIEEEVRAAREFLRGKYIEADIGLSSCNVLAADSGAIFIIENEGNIRLTTSLPERHIVLVGIEKVVPTLADAFKVAEVTWRYAQYTIPAYVSIISGPSKTGDIEKVITYGAHGPRELHVVFLDNGRSELAAGPFKEVLYCLRCGGCMYECPVFALVAGRFGHKYFIGHGAVWTAFVTGGPARAAPIAYTCMRCGRCTEICPVKIPTAELVVKLRDVLNRME
ncbi:MAG TPA: lactate utilization protein [Candidatus Latescibacteria bacterium]|nr:lactate utilization protein [Candidatus Latescibacterota bacterium]